MMRVLLLIALSSVLFLSVQGYTVYDVYCSDVSCSSCQSECNSFCTGLYQLDSAYCYPQYYNGNFSYNSVDCYCELSGSGWTLTLFAPVVVVLWVCFALLVGALLVRRTVIKKYEAKYMVVPSEESVVMYSALPSQCQRLAAALVSVLTCGVFLPFLVVKMIQRFYDNFRVGDVQGEFHGDAGDYCLQVFCVNNALSCVTCGLWVCCGCAHKRQAEWIDSHTSVRGAPHQRGLDWVYLWRARPSWIRRAMTNVLSCLTCGLVAPLFFVRNLKETLSQVHFGGKQVHFTDDTDAYVDAVWAPSVLYNLLTCGGYRVCGCAEVAERGYVDTHLVAVGGANLPSTSEGSHSSLPPTPTVSYPSLAKSSAHEQAPLLAERPPPYQYGAPSHPYNPSPY